METTAEHDGQSEAWLLGKGEKMLPDEQKGCQKGITNGK